MKPKTIIILVFVILALVIVIQNTEIITLKLFFWKISMSRIIFMSSLIFFGFVIGFLVAKLVKRF